MNERSSIPPAQAPAEDGPPAYRKRRAPRKAGLFEGILLVLAVVGTFGWMLPSDVLWTEYDAASRTAYEEMQHWSEALQMEHLISRELLPVLTYFAEDMLPLPTATAHRSFNLVLHLAASLLLLKLLQRFQLSGAFAASLVFALHPSITQTLFWPGYRMELIGLIAVLSALLLGLQRGRKGRYLLSLLASILAIFLHPAGVFLPVLLALCIYFREKHLALENFNATLPMLCASLLIGTWMQSQAGIDATAPPRLHVWLYNAGQNLYFFLQKAIYPNDPSLFYPYDTQSIEQANLDLSLLPFCLFLPFYAVALFKLTKPWGRALLLGLTAFILLLLPGIQSPGTNLAGDPAHEDYNLYIALPAIIALIICGSKSIVNKVALAGKGLWYVALALFLFMETVNSFSFSRQLGSTERMWRTQTSEWPEQWMPAAALAYELQGKRESPEKRREQMRLLEKLLKKHPDRLPERYMLLRTYLDAGEVNNALREYRNILRETEPEPEFIEEAARFLEFMNLPREAERARARLQQKLHPDPSPQEKTKPSAASILRSLPSVKAAPEQ